MENYMQFQLRKLQSYKINLMLLTHFQLMLL